MCIRLNNAGKWARAQLLDEAHFHLGGYVNKPNCRIWDTEKPHACIGKPTHSKRVTVWCRFWSRGIIGPVFFENEQEEAVTDNGDLYRAMLNEFMFTKIEAEDIGNICIKQDGATSYTAEATLDVLRPVFKDRIISRRADVVWPPRSCVFLGCHHKMFFPIFVIRSQVTSLDDKFNTHNRGGW